METKVEYRAWHVRRFCRHSISALQIGPGKKLNIIPVTTIATSKNVIPSRRISSVNSIQKTKAPRLRTRLTPSRIIKPGSGRSAPVKKCHRCSADLPQKNRLESHTAYSVVSWYLLPSPEAINTKKNDLAQVSVRVFAYISTSSSNLQMYRSTRNKDGWVRISQWAACAGAAGVVESGAGMGPSFFLHPVIP